MNEEDDLLFDLKGSDSEPEKAEKVEHSTFEQESEEPLIDIIVGCRQDEQNLDLTIRIATSLTVKDLKTRIQQQHETKPDPSTQKILSKAKELSDDHPISSLVA